MPAMQIVSVKFDPEIVEAIKAEAQRAALPYTHLIRQATIAELERRRKGDELRTCDRITQKAELC